MTVRDRAFLSMLSFHGFACLLPVLVFAVAATTGCARVKFYSDANMKKQTALRYYGAKPYLLVARGSENLPTTVTIVYLPDPADITYAKFKPGMGSHKFSVALSNGMLTNYGQEGDPKVAEGLNAIASLITAKGALISAEPKAQTKLIVSGARDCPWDFSEVTNYRDQIEQQVKNAEALERYARPSACATLPQDLMSLTRFRDELMAVANSWANAKPDKPHDWPRCQESAKKLRELVVKLTSVALSKTEACPLSDKRDAVVARMQSIADKLDPPQLLVDEPAFELYEISVEKGSTKLMRVKADQ